MRKGGEPEGLGVFLVQSRRFLVIQKWSILNIEPDI